MVSLLDWELCGEIELCAADDDSKLPTTNEAKSKSDHCNKNYEATPIKVVLLGESGVGKSSIALRFVSNEFRHYTDSTLGANYLSRKMNVNVASGGGSITSGIDFSSSSPTGTTTTSDNQEVTFQIWDTAGQEKFHSLVPMYYRGASAVILVFDVSRRGSLTSLDRWVAELRRSGPPDLILALCGNKSDLINNDRKISYEDALRYAHAIGAFYIEASARDATNVSEVFREIAIRVAIIRAATETSVCTGLDDSFDVDHEPIHFAGMCCNFPF